MMNQLKIQKVLEFCDVPQIFIAQNNFGAQFICLLYEDEPVCRYTAVLISDDRLNQFLHGAIDLRELFVHPENDQEYFDVFVENEKYSYTRLTDTTLSENRLPEPGFVFEGERQEQRVIRFPASDFNIFSRLIRSHGWVAL